MDALITYLPNYSITIMAFELRLAPFPFHRSEYLFIYSLGASKVGTELALFFYWPVPVPTLFIARPASQPGTGTRSKEFCTTLCETVALDVI